MEWDEDTQSEFDLQRTPEYIAEITEYYTWCQHNETGIRRRLSESGQVIWVGSRILNPELLPQLRQGKLPPRLVDHVRHRYASLVPEFPSPRS